MSRPISKAAPRNGKSASEALPSEMHTCRNFSHTVPTNVWRGQEGRVVNAFIRTYKACAEIAAALRSSKDCLILRERNFEYRRITHEKRGDPCDGEMLMFTKAVFTATNHAHLLPTHSTHDVSVQSQPVASCSARGRQE